MAEIVLEAEVRNSRGKQSRALRRSGKVPGIYYSRGEENIAIAASEKALRPVFGARGAFIINLKLEGGKDLSCVIRDVQYDPITDRPVHFDLQGIKAEEELTIGIPVILSGTAAGVKNGGIMQHIMHTLHVSCLPRYIPQNVTLDVTGLEINTSIHVKDLKLENVKILDSEENAIVAVIPPAAVVEETPAAEAEVLAEPEVIGKGKKPEEGEEGAEEGKKPEAAKKAEAPKKEDKK